MEGSRWATHVLLIHLSLLLNFVRVKANFKSVSEVSKFRMNPLSIHNLPKLIFPAPDRFESSCVSARRSLPYNQIS